MGTLMQDIRVALRMLWKNPGFSAVVVLTLALGIGANTAVFSIVNSFLFSPLPVRDPGRLIVMAYEDPKAAFPHEVSNADLRDFEAHSEVTSEMTAFLVNFAGLSNGERSEREFVTLAKGNYCSKLGVEPALGRLFLPSEGETAGADPVIVLGYAYWRRRFNGDPAVVGKSVNLNGQPVTIIGVAPKPFFGTFYIVDSEVYAPLGLFASSAGSVDILTDRTQRQLRVLAHLKPGVSMAQASASLQVIADNLARAYPQTDAGLKMDLIPEKLARPEAASASFWPVIASVFMGLVGLVMLVTCMNVTNLLLSRASVRAKEMAVRASLGAGRMRLFRQLLTESLLLAGLGALGGAVMGAWLMKWVESIRLPGDMALRTTQSFDWHMFAFVGALAAASGLLAGLVPAWRATRIDLNDALRESGRSNTSGSGHNRVRSILVVAQTAGSLVVLIMAALFLRSLQQAQKADLGFKPEHVLNLAMDVHELGYDEARGMNFYRELGSRVRALPGIDSAAFAYSVPMGYYTAGRNPLWNEYLAAKLWPGQDAIGHHFRRGMDDAADIEVVGVAKYSKGVFIAEDPGLYYYVPLTQNYSSVRVLHIHSSLPAADIAREVQAQVHALDPNLAVFDVMPMTESLQGGNGYFFMRIAATFAGALGGLSLLLAVVGMYGVISYAVNQRIHEIAVRIALGAQKQNIFAMVIGHGLKLVVAGLLMGVALAAGLSRFLSTLLVNTGAMDPLAYASASLLLVVVAALGCYVPARRAVRVDPMVALHYE